MRWNWRLWGASHFETVFRWNRQWASHHAQLVTLASETGDSAQCDGKCNSARVVDCMGASPLSFRARVPTVTDFRGMPRPLLQNKMSCLRGGLRQARRPASRAVLPPHATGVRRQRKGG